jgi:hypothetical protein
MPSPRMPPSPREAPSSRQRALARRRRRADRVQAAGPRSSDSSLPSRSVEREAAQPGHVLRDRLERHATAPIAPAARPAPVALQRPAGQPRREVSQPHRSAAPRRPTRGGCGPQRRSRASWRARLPAGRTSSRSARATASSAARRGRRRSACSSSACGAAQRAGDLGVLDRVEQHALREPAQRVDRLPVPVRRPDERRDVGDTSGSMIESRCSRCSGPTSIITVSNVSACSPSVGVASAATVATASSVVRRSLTAQTIVRDAW